MKITIKQTKSFERKGLILSKRPPNSGRVPPVRQIDEAARGLSRASLVQTGASEVRAAARAHVCEHRRRRALFDRKQREIFFGLF